MAIDETQLAQQGRDSRQRLLQEIPWNQDLWNDLIERYHGAGLPHASLLLGNDGVGKRSFAFKLAKFLLCQSSAKKQAQATVNVPCSHLVMVAGQPTIFASNQHTHRLELTTLGVTKPRL